MGGSKDAWLEAQERGWSSIDGHVCARCFDDTFLRSIVKQNVEAETCDFCGRTSRKRAIAAPADILLRYIAHRLYTDYTDPVNELSYDSAEGGYQGDMTDIHEVVMSEYGYAITNENFANAVIGAISGYTILLCKRNYARLSDGEVLSYGWERFCEITKHQRRYFFGDLESLESPDDQELPPAAVLEELSAMIKELKLIKSLPAGTPIFRARVHKAKHAAPATATALGTVPVERCLYANRMSPAGVPMFYGALDRRTAVREVIDPDLKTRGMRATSGAFAAGSAKVLDLRSIPAPPSFFDLRREGRRVAIRFLEEFVEQVSRPIKKDGREHIDYVPTQIFTEFLRQRWTRRLDGMIYPSSRTDTGGSCIVLFSDSDFCTEIGGSAPTWKSGLHLQFDPATVETGRLKDFI